ncbi:hypothetical protein [Neoroseomonas oryzicola]|uniref:Uncharacterized protein n=1 Tax=Neoroseomonas oryzicola TaxID=535904 RepID=A0A9X9WCS7_9PROT|nr:hypothetical protein [Neoroseomonas oryzicola]MBR0658137.1 hypothetical protein [Neoroseomonas oryzicola]NKE16047.1 hypothetical protein [Neoroseomonas oryzicola]
MDTIALGPFSVTPDGALLPRAPDAAPALDFAWRGRRCTARLAPDGMRIAADAARIPSTADPGADRRRAFDAAARLPGRLPAGWRARLTPDHRIRVETSAPLRAPANATALVAALVRFVLALDPYLDGLEAEGAAWTPPAA